MASLSIQTSGDFDLLDPVAKYDAREELHSFLKRHQHGFKEMNLHAHLKQLNGALGNNPLFSCSLNLFTDDGRFHAVEEGYGLDAALRRALLNLRYQIEKHLDFRRDQKVKAEGRRALSIES